MKRFLTPALLCVVIAIAVSTASALTTSVTGTQVTLNYDEPSQNKDGSPLKDLAKTTGYYRLDPQGSRVKCGEQVASSVAGGQPREILCLVPVLSDQEADATLSVTATDLSGNESVESAPVVQRIDRLAPAAPK